MFTIHPRDGFKWIEPKDLDLYKNTSHSFKGFLLEADTENPK